MNLRVWVACLACYNAGRLIGDWFDAADAPGDMAEWREAMTANAETDTTTDLRWLRDHDIDAHEELWCLDTEGFAALGITGEMSPVTAREIAEAVEDLDDDDAAAFGAWYGESSYTVIDWHTVRAFTDARKAIVDHEWEYAFDLVGELWGEALRALPNEVRDNIDWKAVAHDMGANGGWFQSVKLPDNRVLIYTDEG